MTEMPSAKRIRPAAFGRYCQARSERTVEMTQQAIAKLQTQGQTVTLGALAQATQEFDAKGKGLQPATILRNPQAAELFRKHSPACQAHQHKAKAARRKRPKPSSDVRVAYRGLRPFELIAMIEDLKQQISGLKAQETALQAAHQEANRLRDQALQQNARQLAALTKSATQVRAADVRNEPATPAMTTAGSAHLQ